MDVTSAIATVRLPLRISPDLGPKTVALPHGWGHQHSGLSIARETEGVNVNILAAGGPEALDPISGMALLTGFPVTVKKAAASQVTGSWSGI